MILPVFPSSALTRAALLLVLAVAATPGQATGISRARLVHCGDDTCLRISGHRPSPAVAVRIGGQDLAVEGGRAWRATVPLATARTWPTAAGYALTLTLVDTRAGTESVDRVMLPPGALGQRVELASLIVHAP